MDSSIEDQIFAVEHNLAREQQKLQELRLELNRRKKEEEVAKFDKFKGKLCFFWDKERMDRDTFRFEPVGGMIRPFVRAERRAPLVQGDPGLRFYASDMYTGEEIGHGWKNFRVLTVEDLEGRMFNCHTTETLDGKVGIAQD